METKMEKDVINIIKWSDYMAVGLAVAIYISYMGLSSDHLFLLVTATVLFALTGVKENFKALAAFARRYWIIIGVMVMYLIYYGVMTRNADSLKFVAASFGVVATGYIVAVRSGDEFENIYFKMWILLFAVIILDIIRMVGTTRNVYFVSNQVEFGVVLIFAALSALFIEDNRYKAAGLITAVVSAILLLARGALNLSNAGAVVKIIPHYLTGNMWEKVFGRGLLITGFYAPECYENTFTTLLFDFGILAFLLYISALIYAVIVLVRSGDSSSKKQAVLVCVMILAGSFYHMEYWTNVIYLIYTGIGILLGRGYLSKVGKEKRDE